MQANKYIGKFLETLDNLDKNGEYVPGLIMSRPGFGKTTSIEKWCKYHNYNLTTLIASNFSSDDILGLQTLNNGVLRRVTPSWYNSLVEKSKNGNRNVLFLDEISAADSYIQSPLFNLIFNHDLAGHKLPDNTLIVAAGNYADDLGNSFKMTAPLVNRFMILNLRNEDFSIMDILDGGIESVGESSIGEYLGITDDPLVYSYDNFKDWIKSNPSEFQFGKSEYSDDDSLGGLLGFISLRSFDYSLRFAQSYMSNFGDSIWIRIVGDTLGMSNKREGKTMRSLLEANQSKFLRKASASDDTIASLCTEILNDGAFYGYMETSNGSNKFERLKKLIMEANVNNVTTNDLSKFSDLVQKCSKYYPSEISQLNSLLISKLDI